MKILNILLYLILLSLTYQKECLRNCFLGQAFFSAPLDEKGCCRYDWAENRNCRNFIAIKEHKFMCDSCNIGYKWEDNICIKIPETENCINPEIRSIPFNECRICRFSDTEKYVPIFDNKKKATEQYDCKKMEEVKLSDHNKDRLKFCEASAALDNEIFCYRCIEGYYFDWRLQKCKQIKKNGVFGGCLISVDSAHCSICRKSFQLNQEKEICIERKIKINLEKLNKIKVSNNQNNINLQKMQNMRQNMPNMNGAQMQNIPNMNNNPQMQQMMMQGQMMNGGQMPNMNVGQMMMPGGGGMKI